MSSKNDNVVKVGKGELPFHCRKYDVHDALERPRGIFKSEKHTSEAELSIH